MACLQLYFCWTRVCVAAGSHRDIAWRDVKVGQVLRVQDDELFPADLLCLHSALEDKACFIKTTNLDGARSVTGTEQGSLAWALGRAVVACNCRPVCQAARAWQMLIPSPYTLMVRQQMDMHDVAIRRNRGCRLPCVSPAHSRVPRVSHSLSCCFARTLVLTGCPNCSARRRVQPEGAPAGGPARGRAGGGGGGHAPACDAHLRAAQRQAAHLPRARHHCRRRRTRCVSCALRARHPPPCACITEFCDWLRMR